MIVNADILRILPVSIRDVLRDTILENSIEHLEEINIRVNKPLILKMSDVKGKNDLLTDIVISEQLLKEALGYISNFSMYAYEDEVREGFITIKGGHRIGITGKVVMEGNDIKTIKNISSLNIRIARQIKGCANEVLKEIMSGEIGNILIISPPCMGKTTLLREMVRVLSDRFRYKIGIVDERGEIAACHMGVPQNDIGQRCDVMDGCRKDKGIMMLVRSMSPDIIAVDELGGICDVEAVKMAGNYGGIVISTIHGNGISSIFEKKFMNDLLNDKFFKYFIVIGNNRIAKIYDKDGNCYGKDYRLFGSDTGNNIDGL